jgi:repressor LexA
MHAIQKSILQLFDKTNKIPLKLRWLARAVGEEHPQKIKYHLEQLEKIGLLCIDLDRKEIIKVERNLKGGAFVSLPIMGEANCGNATALAEDKIEGFLKISKGLLPKSKTNNLFVLKAVGNSMNRAITKDKKNIENGDYVIVEKNQQPENNEVIVSIIDGCANIKRFFHKDNQIALVSESTENYSPIFIHEEDSDNYQIAGKVLSVIKNPRFN